MRGSRVRRLNHLYEQITGRKPQKAVWTLEGDKWVVTQSQIRRFRHDWQKARGLN